MSTDNSNHPGKDFLTGSYASEEEITVLIRLASLERRLDLLEKHLIGAVDLINQLAKDIVKDRDKLKEDL